MGHIKVSADLLEIAIDRFFDHYQKSHEHLICAVDPEWPSPCELGPTESEGQIYWQPVRRHDLASDFSDLEKALGFELHPDLKTHYARYWSGTLEAEAPAGHVSLIYLWNQQDVDRLIENLIGHVVACRNNKTPFAGFFATTEADSDYFLTINNHTGAIQLEQPGYQPLRVICNSLAEFYDLLVPSPPVGT